MQKFKKHIAILTVLLLFMTGIPNILVSAESATTGVQYTDADKEAFKFSYNFYKTLGVINGELNIDSTISRGLWADIVVRYFGYGSATEAAKGTHFFADYDSKYDKIGSVNLAADLGFMGEYDDGKFCPDVDVNYEDVCVSVVKGLGYEMEVESIGGSVDSYIFMANKLGLLKGVSGEKGYPIVASSAVKMLDNALDVQLLGKVVGSKEDKYKKGETVLDAIFNLKRGEGIVTSDSRTSLTTEDSVAEGRIAIDNVTYYYSEYTEGLVGYKVRYYVSSKDTKTIVYLGKINNKIQTINFDDITDYSNRTYYYTVANGKEREWVIPKDCAVIYNGVTITDGYASNLPMYTEDGSLTLINNDSDAEVDVLLIEAYTDFFVGYIDNTAQIIYNYYDPDDIISLKDYDRVELFDNYGSETTLAKMAPNNVLSIARTPDGKSIRIEVCDSNVEDKINGMYTKDGKVTFTIGEVDYKVSSICDVSELTVGFAGVFYLNRKDKIVGFEEKLLMPTGYMINAALDYGLDNTVKIKMLTASGEIQEFKCASKVTIVGENEDVKVDGDKLYKILLNNESEVKSQPVLYDVNDKDEITSLDLVGHSPRLRETNKIQSDGVQYISGGSCFSDGKTFLNSSVLIFYVPMNHKYDDEDYGVIYRSDLQNDGKYSSATLPLYTYQVDGSQLGSDIMVIDESFRSHIGSLGIVESITQTIDNEEPSYILTVFQYGNLNTYYMRASEFNIKEIKAQSSAFAARELLVGDVIGLDYIINAGKRSVAGIRVMYDIATDEYLASQNPSTTNRVGVDTRYFFGDVQTNEKNKLMAMVLHNGNMAVTEETQVGPSVNRGAANYEIHPVGGNIYMYDRGNRGGAKVVRAAAKDIAAYDTVGDKYSTIWVWTAKEAPQMIYIVNK